MRMHSSWISNFPKLSNMEWSFQLLPVPTYQITYILICLKIYWVNIIHLLFLFCYTISLTTDFCYLEWIYFIELWRKKKNMFKYVRQS